MTGRGSLSQRTPPPIWSDGIHYVRSNAKSVFHPMPWFTGAHRTTESRLHRYVETMDGALKLAIATTRDWLKEHPADKVHVKAAFLPAASDLKGDKRRRGRPAKAKLEAFSTYHFTCIAANPYAQVWQCTSYSGEKKAVGRRKSDGKPADETPFRHQKGECSVLIGDLPVRNPDGNIRIFERWAEADEFALDLFMNAPEDDVISWKEGDVVVGRSRNFNIEFNPDINGVSKPFTLWNVTYEKPVYMDKTKPAVTSDDRAARSLRQMQETNPEAYLQIQEARAKARSMDRVPSFSEEPLKFRSIWEAAREAERREKMLMGIPV